MAGAAMTAPRLLGNAAFTGGLCAILVGAFAIWEGSSYAVGTASSMGPGYFPVALGGLLVALGIVLAVQGVLAPHEAAELADLRSLLAILAAIGAFALLVQRAGLVPAVIALVVIGSIAGGALRFPSVLALSIVLSALSYLVFRLFLNLPLPAFAGLG